MRGRPRTPVDPDAFRKAWLDGLPVDQIARRLHVAPYRIPRIAADLGLPHPRPHRASKDVAALWRQGLSVREIADRLSLSDPTIRRILDRLSLTPHHPSPKPDPRLGTVPDSVLAAELGLSRQRIAQMRAYHNIPSFSAQKRASVSYDDIRDLLLAGLSNAAISAQLGAHHSLVRQIRRDLNLPPATSIARDRRDALIQPLAGTMSQRDIAEKTGIPRDAVDDYFQRHPDAPRFRHYNRWNPLPLDRARALLAEGKSLQETAELLGTSTESLRFALRRRK